MWFRFWCYGNGLKGLSERHSKSFGVMLLSQKVCDYARVSIFVLKGAKFR